MDRGWSISVLVVSNDLSDISAIKRALNDAGAFGVYVAGSAQKALATVARVEFAAVVVDADLPDSPGLVLLRQVVRGGYDGPVIFVARSPEKGLAAEALAAGAYEVLPKFENFAVAIPKLVLRGIERARLVQRIRELDAKVNQLEQLVAIGADRRPEACTEPAAVSPAPAVIPLAWPKPGRPRRGSRAPAGGAS